MTTWQTRRDAATGFNVSWDPDDPGWITYRVETDLGEIVAHPESGRWVVAFPGHDTVDQRRTLDAADEEDALLIAVLDTVDAERWAAHFQSARRTR